MYARVETRLRRSGVWPPQHVSAPTLLVSPRSKQHLPPHPRTHAQRPIRPQNKPPRRSDENLSATENAASALGKLLEHRPQDASDPALGGLYVSSLPVTEDREEAKSVHAQLVRFLQHSDPRILGEGNANLPKLVQILVQVLAKGNKLIDADAAVAAVTLLKQMQVCWVGAVSGFDGGMHESELRVPGIISRRGQKIRRPPTVSGPRTRLGRVGLSGQMSRSAAARAPRPVRLTPPRAGTARALALGEFGVFFGPEECARQLSRLWYAVECTGRYRI